MPPTNNTSSPVKRPGLGRRAISSHAVVTRATNPGDPSDVSHPQKQHRPHRPHVVGGGHRSHGRNPSFGKNLNKPQRMMSTHQLGADGTARNHYRKKSAPATPAASPRGGQHIRWDGALDDGDNGDNHAAASMKRNYSSPALRRSSSGALAKKTAADRPHTSSGKKKKTVGFELAGSENDEWEDTTQSPESTRRNSVAQGKDSAENSTILVDPLTFVKRPVPQAPRAASLPEPTSFPQQDHLLDGEEGKQPAEARQEPSRDPEHGDIAARLFSPAHSARAPPAMSSISATAKPGILDGASRNASLTNLASSQNSTRRTPSASNNVLANTPGALTQGTSSSMEGGVSRFIVNNRSAMFPSSRTDSDPNTPSSFLPHYHPQTPPSPNYTHRKTRTSPPARQSTEPPSRTQQKLWLQRTAALNTSPPDSHVSAVSPSAMDPTFMAAAHSRPGVYDTGRGLIMNGNHKAGGATPGGEAKHIRKAYEKTALELSVVRRFHTPTGDSFSRLSSIINDVEAKGAAAPPARPPLGKPFKSAPALTLLRDDRQHSRDQMASSPEPKQLMGRKAPDSIKPPAPQAYLHGDAADDAIDSTTTELPHRLKSQPPSHNLMSTSDETVRVPGPGEDDLVDDSYYPNETDMMIRRMWESREVATAE